MSNSQQMFNAGATKGHAQAKTDEWTQSAKDTANAARDKTADIAQSTADTAHQKHEEASGFIQQTGEQVMNMAQGAVDSVKNTLGVGDHSHKK
ncbi:hypothetical protein BVC80_9099g69 [Macleaya cordata]|uniref:Late embryogenesis abundant protein n=1 Tax=Macleaya cordata TaxID=56857 RepID=A0A200PVQ5_MACCD|nr:hypothetical protein BVC80_9099g69 [Macleaya cordata]